MGRSRQAHGRGLRCQHPGRSRRRTCFARPLCRAGHRLHLGDGGAPVCRDQRGDGRGPSSAQAGLRQPAESRPIIILPRSARTKSATHTIMDSPSSGEFSDTPPRRSVLIPSRISIAWRRAAVLTPFAPISRRRASPRLISGSALQASYFRATRSAPSIWPSAANSACVPSEVTSKPGFTEPVAIASRTCSCVDAVWPTATCRWPARTTGSRRLSAAWSMSRRAVSCDP